MTLTITWFCVFFWKKTYNTSLLENSHSSKRGLLQCSCKYTLRSYSCNFMRFKGAQRQCNIRLGQDPLIGASGLIAMSTKVKMTAKSGEQRNHHSSSGKIFLPLFRYRNLHIFASSHPADHKYNTVHQNNKVYIKYDFCFIDPFIVHLVTKLSKRA